jgi:hypothetical protein
MDRQEWNWYQISQNISIEDVINNPNETWYRLGLSQNKNISMKVIRMDLPNTKGNWSWYHISQYIKMEDVIKYPNERWNRTCLSSNKNITIEVIKTPLPNCTGYWNWAYISLSISMKDVINNPNEMWCRYYLSYNMNMLTNIIDIDLPNAINEWDDNSMMTNKVCVFDYDFVYKVKEQDRSYLSFCEDISMYWIRFKDRVGMCKSKYRSDIDIVCIHWKI